MGNRIAPRSLPPNRATPLTPWQEYERAVAVSRQWLQAWEMTKQKQYLVLADACQRMAQEWLGVAHQFNDISRTVFEHETKKLAPELVPEFELT
jgi:hypothetical protein